MVTGAAPQNVESSQNEQISDTAREEDKLRRGRNSKPRKDRNSLETAQEIILSVIRPHTEQERWLCCPTGVAVHYESLANTMKELCTNDYFNGGIIGVICVAAILVGLQTYDGMEENSVVKGTDNVILAIFTIECVMKIIAEKWRPYLYWTGSEWAWNNFDFIIVLLCMPFIPFGGSSVAVLRMLRLMRIVKLVKKVKQLQMIVMGLVGGLKSIAYILLLLFLVFYLYAILGIIILKENDPWHFGYLWIALLTLFRMATLEDWTDVMYTNIYGCARYDSVYAVTTLNQSRAIYGGNLQEAEFNYLVKGGIPTSKQLCKFNADTYDNGAILRSDFVCKAPGGVVLEDLDEGSASSYTCKGMGRVGISSAMWLSVVYFVSFIMISALVMLSLFVGAVTMSMTESMNEMKAAQKEAEREKRAKKRREKLLLQQQAEAERAERVARGETLGDTPKSPCTPESGKSGSGDAPRRGNMGQTVGQVTTAAISTVAGLKNMRSLKAIAAKSRAKRAGLSIHEQNQRSKMKVVLLKAMYNEDHEAEEIIDPSLYAGRGCRARYLLLSRRCRTIAENEKFNWYITFVIVLAGIMVGVGTDKDVEENKKHITEPIDMYILVMFVAEVIIKLLAEGFKPWVFFNSGWNCFDFVIVVGSILGKTGAINVGSMLTMLRLLRLLRVIKLIKSLPQLQVIVVALLKGFKSIIYIGIILLLVFYMFAILGMILFQKNDPWHFGTLHLAMLTLFRCSTLEDWTDVMYINMYGCVNYGYNYVEGEANVMGCVEADSYAWGVTAALFFFVFIILGALVLLTLFIGVVTTSMEEAQDEMKEEQEVKKEVAELQLTRNIPDSSIALYHTVFRMLDLDGSGSIGEDELSVGLKSVGKRPSDDELKEMLSKVDEDDSGQINFAEFVAFMNNLTGDQNKNGDRNGKQKEGTSQDSGLTPLDKLPPLAATPTPDLRGSAVEAFGSPKVSDKYRPTEVDTVKKTEPVVPIGSRKVVPTNDGE